MEKQDFTIGQVHEAMIRLQGVGLTPKTLQKVIEKKELAEQVVKVVWESLKKCEGCHRKPEYDDEIYLHRQYTLMDSQKRWLCWRCVRTRSPLFTIELEEAPRESTLIPKLKETFKFFAGEGEYKPVYALS